MKEKLFSKKLIILLLGMAGIGLLFYLRSKNGVPKVEVSKVQLRELSKMVSASGQTAVSAEFVQKSKVSGSIEKINYKSGDKVKKGDVIIEFDSKQLKALLDASYSEYLRAKATLDSYNQELKAAKSLVEVRRLERDEALDKYMDNKNESRKQVYKNAEALYQNALAQLKSLENSKGFYESSARSAYSSYLSNLESYNNGFVKAFDDGILVIGNGIEKGAFVSQGQILFSILKDKNIVFKSEIDEADISQVKVGMTAKISLDSYPGTAFEGKVISIDPKVIKLPNGSNVLYCEVEFDNSKISPIIGLNGTIDIETQKTEPVLSIPNLAVFEQEGKNFVYVVGKENRVKRQEILLGFQGDDFVQVIEGLNEGDMVVLNPPSDIKDGDKVSF